MGQVYQLLLDGVPSGVKRVRVNLRKFHPPNSGKKLASTAASKLLHALFLSYYCSSATPYSGGVEGGTTPPSRSNFSFSAALGGETQKVPRRSGGRALCSPLKHSREDLKILNPTMPGVCACVCVVRHLVPSHELAQIVRGPGEPVFARARVCVCSECVFLCVPLFFCVCACVCPCVCLTRESR